MKVASPLQLNRIKRFNIESRRCEIRERPKFRSIRRCMLRSSSNYVSGEFSRRDNVLHELSRIIDPDFELDIVSCGFVKKVVIDDDSGDVSVEIELTTPACPVKGEFEHLAQLYIRSLAWVRNVDINFTSQKNENKYARMVDSDPTSVLRNVSNIIAVSSCKGGVGKSTVAVNLAYTLMSMGAKVGLFDADIYGPSLPTMISPFSPILRMDADTKMISPVEYDGVKCVSFGWASGVSDGEAAIMRGPMVSGIVNQLLTTTDWGDLDYLIVDMPPGTGDIQLTLCQLVPFDAALVVTTPQKLSYVDVVRGVRMFAKLEVPCIAVIENMSYFDVPTSAPPGRIYPFGKNSSGNLLSADFGIANLFHLPILDEISICGDKGIPITLAFPLSDISSNFQDIATSVVRELAKLNSSNSTLKNGRVNYIEPLNQVHYISYEGSLDNISIRKFNPADIRRADKSAASVDEWTGEKLITASSISNDVKPAKISPLGNYAVLIIWEDGFNQVVPYSQFADIKCCE